MLRDKFAMAAMQGLVSCRGIRCDELDVSAKAYQIADAMMMERAKQDFSGDPKAVTVVYNNHIHPGIIDGPPIQHSPPRKP